MRLRRALAASTAAVLAMTAGVPATAAVPTSREVLHLDRLAADTGSRFTAVSPIRVLDTRTGTGAPAGKVPAGGTITVNLSAQVPTGTTAVLLNLAGVAPTSRTFVTAWPAEETRPAVSSLNLAAGEVRSNAVTVALGTSRSVRLYNSVGTVHLVADLVGYYAPNGEALYRTRVPSRVLDTRQSGQPIPPGGTITVDTSPLLPSAGARAITINLTVVAPTATTYVTAWPTGATRPNASSINVTRATTTANQVTVRLGADKDFQLYNSAGNAHVIVDLVGDYDTATGNLFHTITPTRIVDTRIDGSGPFQSGQSRSYIITEDPTSADARISAMVVNVTGTGGTSATFLTLYPSGSTRPITSTINLGAGQTASNLATTALGWGSDTLGAYYGFNVYNSAGTMHVILDWAGYFAP